MLQVLLEPIAKGVGGALQVVALIMWLKRQTHAPEAGNGKFKHWDPKRRMPDFKIEEAMKNYAKKTTTANALHTD